MADAPKLPPRLRRRKRRAKGCAVVLLGLLATLGLLIVGGIGYLRTEDFQRRSTAPLGAVLSAQTCEQVQVGRLEVSVWPPAVSLHNLALHDADTGHTLARVGFVHAPLVLRDGGVKLGRLVVDEPDIHLPVGKDAPKWLCGNNPPPKELPWHSLDVRDGRLRIEHPKGMLTIDDLQAVPVDGPITDISAVLRVDANDYHDQTEVLLEDVVLGPDRIAIPDLDITLAPLQLQGAGEIPLDGEIDAHFTAAVILPELDPLMEAPRAAHGTLDVDLRVAGPPNDPELHAVVLGKGLQFDTPGRRTPLLTFEFGDVVIIATATLEGVEIHDGSELRWADGVGRLSAFVDPKGNVQRATLLVDDISFEQVLVNTDAAYTPWVDFRADGEFHLTGTLQPLRLTGPWKVTVGDFRVASEPIANPKPYEMLNIPYGYGAGILTMDKDHVVLDAHTFSSPRNHGTVVADIGFGDRGPLDLHFELHEADLRDMAPLGPYTKLQGTGTMGGRLWGRFNKLQFDGWGDLYGFHVIGIKWADHLTGPIQSPDMKSLVLPDARAAVGPIAADGEHRTRYRGAFALDFRPPIAMDTDIIFTGGRTEDVTDLFIEIPEFEGDLEGELSLRGPLFDLDGEAHLYTRDVNLFGERFETGEAHGYMDTGEFTLDDLRFLRNDETEGVIMRGSIGRKWALNMEVISDGLKLETMDWIAPTGLPVEGKASLVARVDNTLFEPHPHGRILVQDVTYGGRRVEPSWVVFQTKNGIMTYGGTLVGGHVLVDGTLGLWDEQPYQLFATFDDFPAHTLYPEAADGQPITATVDGTLELSGKYGDNPTPVNIDAQVDRVVASWDRHILTNPTPWRYEQDGTEWELKGLALRGGETGFGVKAKGGKVQPLDVDGQGTLDADLLRAMVPGLTRADGRIDVRAIVTGRGEDVAAAVDARLDAPLLRHSAFPAALEDVRGHVVATESRYDLLSLDASVGGGSVRAVPDEDGFRGYIDAESWFPTYWKLQVEARDAQVQWTETLAPAIGDADIRFGGPHDELLLEGDVNIEEMTFSDRIDWEDYLYEVNDWLLVSAAPTDDDPYFGMDVRIHAPGTVRIDNNLAQARASAELAVIGDTSRAGLTGWVRVYDGRAFLQDREFRVERGELWFRDPWTWDPDLDFDLLTDITSRGRRYRVNYLVFGPYSDWRTATRSDPPLPQADVNALLWYGVTADDLENMGELGEALVASGLDLFLTDRALSSNLGGDIREQLDLLDRVDIVTGVNVRGEYSADPRLLVEKRNWRVGDTEIGTALAEVNLLNGEFFLQGERQMSDNVTLSAWYANRQRDRVLPIGGAYGIDLQWRAEWDFQ